MLDEQKKNGPRKKRQRRPTMGDVAQLAGVSQATVSLVLNDVGGSRVQASTVEAVRKAARDVGYSLTRRSRVGRGTTQTIGYVIEDTFTNPMVNIAIEAARQAAWEADAVLFVLPTLGDSQLRSAALDVLLEQRLVGVILSSFFTNRIRPPSALRNIASVLVNCYDERGQLPALLPAHADGARRGVAHLVSRGHRRIAMINGDRALDAFRDRVAGYKGALKSAGLSFDNGLFIQDCSDVTGGREATARLMDLPDPPSAIFCATDTIAIGAYEELQRRGIVVGRDVAILGFDNDPKARWLDPGLSTVEVPHAEMGRRAVQHLLAVRDHEEEICVSGNLRVATPLILRGST
ncbi:LacI family DNA-binding transcriptional regulator [Martelella endophytica]|uniref:LacI family DNA-binding transcriptional regulator n=1 Tax=Martelella endophytica TaxID=1486262 RepID=UPI0006969656|nr:LacI family DNA-binding transcriptional regulator [Martelella endophytica]